ncbi:uncharacterized protein LOC116130496 [Pistacia vera]|uniref:uncharacterized protein LOC116130496 n=1 Tax=Pistacia vera TaxID=55513 RepID=UPI001263B774|nr:uncharacterized protein LOC116130496 [Pistacia vera]
MKPFSQEVTKLWNEWEIRVMVLLSLFLQIILVIFGSRRKYTRNIQIFLVVWLAYLTADWVATVALGNLARNQVDHDSMSFQSNNKLQALWAPFLLLHLGGPDTITAYSLEDNELWLRHFLGLVIQVLLAIYVMIRSWNNNTILRFIAVPIFITGIVKYGERSLVLWFSSAQQLKNSLRSSHDTGPDFGEVMEHGEPKVVVSDDGQDKSKQKIDHIESDDEQDKSKQKINHIKSGDGQDRSTQKIDHYLVVADLLFKRFRCLFADLILDHYERKESYSLIHEKSAKEAFKLVAIELGFMYDVLYTKASTIYSGFGIFLRCFYFFSHVSVSVIFLIIVFIMEKHAYSLIDISITCSLLVGAIFLEIYAFIILLFSDWTKLWLCTHNLISNDTPYDLHDRKKRWSGSVGQYNLFSFCLQDISTKTAGVQKLIGVKETIEKYQYLTWDDVEIDLRESIFRQLVEKAKRIEGDLFNIKLCKELLAQRGDNVLHIYGLDALNWSTIEVEFDHSLLLWHIATDLCYYDDYQKRGFIIKEVSQLCSTSKCVSDYMLYLLVVCPIMLPKGIGEIRYRETCAEAMKFFKRKRFGTFSEISKACESLLQVKTDDSLEKIKGGRSLSLLFYGCRLANQLQKLESNLGWSEERKWKMISDVWIEMLTYAASHCGWRPHGQQLMNGGELLTHELNVGI